MAILFIQFLQSELKNLNGSVKGFVTQAKLKQKFL